MTGGIARYFEIRPVTDAEDAAVLIEQEAAFAVTIAVRVFWNVPIRINAVVVPLTSEERCHPRGSGFQHAISIRAAKIYRSKRRQCNAELFPAVVFVVVTESPGAMVCVVCVIAVREISRVASQPPMAATPMKGTLP
jgi:hypothetical protein